MSRKRFGRFVSFAVICCGFHGVILAQGKGLEGLREPGELAGPDAKVVTISDSDKPYADAFVALLKDLKMEESELPKFDKFIEQYPKNDIAYFWRATINACVVKPPKLADALRDLDSYRNNEHSDLFPSQDTEALSLHAKIEAAQGHQLAALEIMKKTATKDIRKADNLFNAQGVKPETTSDFCTWNLTDLNQLVVAAPHDAWPHILLGLYYEFFARFDENYYPQAAAAYRKAATLDNHSALIPYLQGELYNQATFWGVPKPKPWVTTALKAGESAEVMFSRAIANDPKFAPAYEARAEVYLDAKKPALAVKDFDKALAIEPDNSTCHSDKGIAESDLGNHFAAISEFGEALRAKLRTISTVLSFIRIAPTLMSNFTICAVQSVTTHRPSI